MRDLRQCECGKYYYFVDDSKDQSECPLCRSLTYMIVNVYKQQKINDALTNKKEVE